MEVVAWMKMEGIKTDDNRIAVKVDGSNLTHLEVIGFLALGLVRHIASIDSNKGDNAPLTSPN